jgi:hypothetical protein
MRRFATVTEALRVRLEPGGYEVIKNFFLAKGDRVEVLGGPVQHDLRWWEIRVSKPGRAPFEGWVAEGDGGAIWLMVDPEEEPRRGPTGQGEILDPPERPADKRDFRLTLRVAIVLAVLILVVFILWLFR